MLPFNKFEDYYERLGVTNVASDADLREAFRKMSLKLHPDKQLSRTIEERVSAEEKFHQMSLAYRILTEPATRQAYDRARDKLDAELSAGVVVTNEATKPPPSCEDVGITLHQAYTGTLKYVRYTRRMFEGTKWEKKSDDTFKLRIRPGEMEGATFWFKEQGDVTTQGKADLVFVLYMVRFNMLGALHVAL